MAEEKKKRRVVKKTETVRERAAKASGTAPKPRRLRTTAGKVSRPIKAAHRAGQKEYYLPMPDNRAGRFLNKRRNVIPRFLRNAWAELRLVTWPNRRETVKLTIAVFVFAFVFAFVISLVDYGLDKVFRQLFL
jgi:preprotein translocase subunit SecE